MVVASIAVMMAEMMAEMEAARAFDVEQDWEVAETGSTMDTAQKTLLPVHFYIFVASYCMYCAYW